MDVDDALQAVEQIDPEVVTPADHSVRIPRKLRELSQNDLADICVIARLTTQAIRNNPISSRVETARFLSRALYFHAALLLLPGRDVEVESAARSSLRGLFHACSYFAAALGNRYGCGRQSVQ